MNFIDPSTISNIIKAQIQVFFVSLYDFELRTLHLDTITRIADRMSNEIQASIFIVYPEDREYFGKLIVQREFFRKKRLQRKILNLNSVFGIGYHPRMTFLELYKIENGLIDIQYLLPAGVYRPTHLPTLGLPFRAESKYQLSYATAPAPYAPALLWAEQTEENTGDYYESR